MDRTEQKLHYPGGCTFSELVQHFCNLLETIPDPEENKLIESAINFIVCYRRYSTAHVFFRELVGKLKSGSKIGGILSLLRLWIMKYFARDFYSSKRLRYRSLLTMAIKFSNTKDAKTKFELNRLKLAILRQYRRLKQIASSIGSRLLAPIKLSKGLFDFTTEEIARHLTLIEFNMFQSIDLDEFVNQKTTKLTNLKSMVERSNNLSYWVASHILAQKSAESQTNVICRFVMIAHHCENLGNYNSVMSLIGGLNFQFIYRLRERWELKTQFKILLANIKKLCLAEMNYHNYREVLVKRRQLLKTGVPTVPYIGIFTRDLTFIDEGNTDFIEPDGANSPKSREKRVNIQKLDMISGILDSIRPFQLVDYHNVVKEKNPTLMKHLTVLPRWSDDRLNKASESIRPRRPLNEDDATSSDGVSDIHSDSPSGSRTNTDDNLPNIDLVDLSNHDSDSSITQEDEKRV